jgi:hypothetical protein
MPQESATLGLCAGVGSTWTFPLLFPLDTWMRVEECAALAVTVDSANSRPRHVAVQSFN